MKEKLSEKELALFQAVIDLIEEDADIHSIKVSDITNRAGIGKGTAYEYFSSKEEMVAKAIIWSGEKMFQKIMEILRTTGSLKGQIMAVLDFIATEMSESRCSTQLMRLQGQECRMKENLYREFTKFGGPQCQVESVLRILMEQGKQEGTIPVKMPETFVTMVLMAGFMSYFVYLLEGLETEEVPREQTKEFLQRNILLAFSSSEEQK